MKSVLVLVDDGGKDILLRNQIIESLNRKLGDTYKKEYMYVENLDIKNCVGCFNCWVKTPGRCIIEDDNEKKNRLFIESDYIIAVSRISYGMYSSSFKVVFDRIIPNISPFFELIKGEMHHKKRYNKELNMFVIGYGTKLYKDERQTFKELFYRNMINFHCNNNEFLIIEETNKLDQRLWNKLDSFCGGN